ncbi:hypothetical protein HS125_05600 [bacterium]|nr:hypothetical protein [bacterium]
MRLDMFWKTRRRLVASVFVAALVVVLLGAVGILVAPILFLSSEQVARMQAFMDNPIGFPAEWEHAADISPELEKGVLDYEASYGAFSGAAGSFTDIVRELEGKVETGALSRADWANLTRLVQSENELHAAFAQMGSASGYNLSRAHAIDDGFMLRNWTVQRLEQLRAVGAARRGDWRHAFDTAAAILASARVDPPRVPLYLRIAQPSQVGASHLLAAFARACTSPILLREVLLELEPYRPAPHQDKVDALLEERIAILLQRRAEGLPVHLGPEMTGRDLLRAEYNMEHYVSRPSASRPVFDNSFSARWRQLKETREYLEPLPADFRRSWLRLLAAELIGLDRLAEDYLYLMFVEEKPPFDTYPSGEARTYFDLARLAMAERIVELEQGVRPARMEDLVPAVFPEQLIDAESDKPYLFSEARGHFYGVGPNGQDDSAVLGADDIVLDASSLVRLIAE